MTRYETEYTIASYVNVVDLTIRLLATYKIYAKRIQKLNNIV